MTIFDGNSRMSPMIKRACGQQTSGCGMYSSGRFLFVEFSSDGSVTRRGFSATFSLVSYNYGNALCRLSQAQQHVLSQGWIQDRMLQGREGGGGLARGLQKPWSMPPKCYNKFDNWNLFSNCYTRKTSSDTNSITMRHHSRVFAFISAEIFTNFFIVCLFFHFFSTNRGVASRPIYSLNPSLYLI